MYHCHVHFYLTGHPCREFEELKKMTPSGNFTYEFQEREEPRTEEAAAADVVVANLQGRDVTKTLRVLTEKKSEKAQLIVLAEQSQFSLLKEKLPFMEDLWILPMQKEEMVFRFLKWQEKYKMARDFWETSHFLETTINNVPELIWYKDKEGVHEKVNDSFCKAVNKTKEQTQGQRHAYIWDVEEDDPACIASELEVMALGKTCISEETIKTGDGEKLLTIYKSPLYDLDGSVMGTMGVAIDITQERAYEQEIINKNQTLETIFTTIDCGVMRHSLDGKHVYSINRAALEILGYESLEEMVDKGFDMVAASVVENDKPKLRQAIQGLKRAGDSVSVEYRVQHKNGDILYIMGNVKLLEENRELVYQRFLLDCTAQKMQEKQRERYHAEMIQALSTDYSLVCFFNLDTGTGQVLREDEQAERMFGIVFKGEISLEESAAAYIDQCIYEEDKEALRHFFSIKRFREEAAGKQLDYANYRAFIDDEITYFQVKAVSVGLQDKSYGIVLGFRSVDEEIRREMKKNALLEDALLQAKKASRAKSAFLSNMSHDIRTPMNAIVGFTSLAVSHIDNREQVKDYLKKIMASGNHLLNLINDVLDMSRIESGKMQLDEKPCSMTEIVQGLENLVQPDASGKSLKLDVKMEHMVHDKVCCDSLRLNQVLLNLLGNAIKYTEDGGAVAMTVTEMPGAPAGSGVYEFCIRDTGIGMSQEFVERIFEPFEREKTTTLSGIAGTGLGMAITKNIVDMMNGMIEVKSRKGQGTEVLVSFTFSLCQEEKAADRINAADENSGHAFGGPHGCRILLAEDNELNQEIAVALLEEAGFLIDVAGNGQIAVDMLKKAGPEYYQLILMDVQMPVMDGYEAARAIRRLSNEKLASIPIFAMTANAFEEDRQEALRCGMNGHIAKPINVEYLFNTLNEVLA